MWEEIQVLQLFPDPCASTQRYLTLLKPLGFLGEQVRFRVCFQEGLEDCSAAALFIKMLLSGDPPVAQTLGLSKLCGSRSVHCTELLGGMAACWRAANQKVSPGRHHVAAVPGTGSSPRCPTLLPRRVFQSIPGEVRLGGFKGRSGHCWTAVFLCENQMILGPPLWPHCWLRELSRCIACMKYLLLSQE